MLNKFKKDWTHIKTATLKLAESQLKDKETKITFEQFSRILGVFKFLKSREKLVELDKAFVKRDSSKSQKP